MRAQLQRQQQRGVALITAMLVVAMATIIAADLVWDQYLQMRRTESMLVQEQARQYALGAENFGIEILLKDRGDVDETDSKSDVWGVPLGPLELDEGTLGGVIEDLQGRFNINNIYRNGQKDKIAFTQFTRLLELLELEPALAEATLDWIDPDQDVCCIGGAEDDTYTSRNPAHWAANRYMTTTTELLAVQGFDIESYSTLAPYIAALPPGWCGAGDFTPVNVNTASDIVLLALDPNITEANTDQWIAERGDAENAGDPFIDLTAFDGIVEQDLLDGNYLSINSECFGATVTISIGSFRYSMYSLLDRDGKVGTIITRLRYFGAY
jgi:general secretion pathway protein K